MKMNTRKVLEAFDAGKAAGGGAIWTNGDAIYSYGTCLVVRVPGGLAINVTRYSATTSGHQTALYAALLPRIVAHLNERPRMISASELLHDAREVLELADVVAQEVAACPAPAPDTYEVTLLVRLGEGEDSPDKWAWSDLVGGDVELVNVKRRNR